MTGARPSFSSIYLTRTVELPGGAMATFFAGRSSRCSWRFLFFSDMVDISGISWGGVVLVVGEVELRARSNVHPEFFGGVGMSAVEILACLVNLWGWVSATVAWVGPLFLPV